MFEQTSKEILKRVDRMQNGDISSTMERMGIHYGTNYGVPIPQLQQLAKEYDCNNALAFYLFDQPIREAKILSSMLFDIKNIKAIQLVLLSERLNNIELIEQFSRNIFSKLEDLNGILAILINGSVWQKALSVYAVAWRIKSHKAIHTDLIKWGVIQVQMLKGDEGDLLQKASVFLLQSIASNSSEYRAQLIQLTKEMCDSSKTSSNNIAREFLFIEGEL